VLVTDSANSANSLIDCHSGIHNRGHRSNRTRRTHSNHTGDSRNRNIRTVVPAPPPRKAEVAEEDDIIRESVMAPIAAPVSSTPVPTAPRTSPAAGERAPASH
jgi:hypothetical protein